MIVKKLFVIQSDIHHSKSSIIRGVHMSLGTTLTAAIKCVSVHIKLSKFLDSLQDFIKYRNISYFT